MKKLFRYRGSLLVVSIAAISAEPSITLAQSADRGLDEIVVMARRTEERLQDVPISVTAISADTIRQASITGATDLMKVVPTLNTQQTSTGGGPAFALRAIRNGVTSYFNEVPISSSSLEDQIWDLSSVEALPGPQGTLFGRNSTGGAILFVPERPTDEFGGSIEGTIGS